MNKFILKSNFKPTGDQPQAIEKLLAGVKKGFREQTLLGVTGSGKTFTIANVIEKINKPTLVISHNKTLAAQLYGEFRQFFPDNAVHYFVSYYDYYQPEAYIPHTDTYIEKEATINEEIDRLRHAATQSLLNRKNVLIVASVSCIYGLGSREDYEALSEYFSVGEKIKRNELLRRLVKIQYERNDIAFLRGQFRVKGDTIYIHLATGEAIVKIQMLGDVIDKIFLASKTIKIPPTPFIKGGIEKFTPSPYEEEGWGEVNKITILPAKHFMTPEERMKNALGAIRDELKERVKELKKQKKIMEAERLQRKTNYDLEMMEEVGYCNGIENYSRHLTGRQAGSPPETLMDFFLKDYFLIIDESHVTIPQIRGMYAGDQSRKQTLIDFGFRLPSARDNRPLNFQEFYTKINQAIYMSATPSPFEISNSKQVVEQIIRPTGLLDPEIEVRPSKGQVADLIQEIEMRVRKKQRVLVTTLTKQMAEELAAYLNEEKEPTFLTLLHPPLQGGQSGNTYPQSRGNREKTPPFKRGDRGVKIKAYYIHSEVETLERIDILRDLRQGKYDVLVGVNLLREGLDLPEVSLVAILDADIGGFLRNNTSLIQTIGRAARHVEGKAVMYGDKTTPAMRFALSETKRRRKIQEAYNKKHGITPKSVEANLHRQIV